MSIVRKIPLKKKHRSTHEIWQLKQKVRPYVQCEVQYTIQQIADMFDLDYATAAGVIYRVKRDICVEKGLRCISRIIGFIDKHGNPVDRDKMFLEDTYID